MKCGFRSRGVCVCWRAGKGVSRKGVKKRSVLEIDMRSGQSHSPGMARKLRIEYPGAIYHAMNRGDRRELIFMDDADRQRFVETLGEGCAKTGWQVHAYFLMPNHFHRVVETPRTNAGRSSARGYSVAGWEESGYRACQKRLNSSSAGENRHLSHFTGPHQTPCTKAQEKCAHFPFWVYTANGNRATPVASDPTARHAPD